jgi:hypothetical protein
MVEFVFISHYFSSKYTKICLPFPEKRKKGKNQRADFQKGL